MTTIYDGPPICQLDDSGIVRIPLTQGQHAIIDADDWPLVADHIWSAHRAKTGNFYAETMVTNPPWGRRHLGMHELIAGKDADHINPELTLDNRRSNLRPATRSENNANRRKHINNTSGFKGVTWHKRLGKWQAQIRYHGMTVHLGYFNDPALAARAYDRAAIEYFGDYARTNAMLGLLPPEGK